MQRIHFLRVLKNVNVDNTILVLFYKSVIESVLCFCITSWHGNVNKSEKNRLCKITRIGRKLCGYVTSLNDLYATSCLKLAQKIMKDSTHPLHNNYTFLLSGRRLNVPALRTTRYKSSFVPNSIRLCNSVLG